MPFTAALSTQGNTARAVEEVLSQVASLGTPPDLACVFFSPHHLDDAETIRDGLAGLKASTLIGCVGEGIICNDKEIERQPALGLWLGKWSRQIRLTPFHLILEETPDGYSLLGWPDELLNADPARSVLFVVGDPRSFPSDFFLHEVNETYPGVRVMGGMASGAYGEGECRLLLGNEVILTGAVGVLLEGDIGIRSIVSQGCRPIGTHTVVTRGRENIIEHLGGKPALEKFQEVWQTLRPADRALINEGLHIGLVMNEYRGEFQRGDFLVRNVLGLDPSSGAMGITDHVRVGQTVQFHVRDAESADEDLHTMLKLDVNAHAKKPSAALVFSCNGRGTRMFSRPHHDAQAVHAEVGKIPLVGFFAAGEFGPVGGKNFIHGFTASLALVED